MSATDPKPLTRDDDGPYGNFMERFVALWLGDYAPEYKASAMAALIADSIPLQTKMASGFGFVWGLGSVTACLDCGCLVPGGPTRCRRCAALLLCRLEWSKDWCSECRGCSDECRVCGHDRGGHAPDCALDAALTAAGLDAEERERVRGG